jgi:hypothetical protein
MAYKVVPLSLQTSVWFADDYAKGSRSGSTDQKDSRDWAASKAQSSMRPGRTPR